MSEETHHAAHARMSSDRWLAMNCHVPSDMAGRANGAPLDQRHS